MGGRMKGVERYEGQQNKVRGTAPVLPTVAVQ